MSTSRFGTPLLLSIAFFGFSGIRRAAFVSRDGIARGMDDRQGASRDRSPVRGRKAAGDPHHGAARLARRSNTPFPRRRGRYDRGPGRRGRRECDASPGMRICHAGRQPSHDHREIFGSSHGDCRKVRAAGTFGTKTPGRSTTSGAFPAQGTSGTSAITGKSARLMPG